MADPDVRDPSWETDLIWEFFHQKPTEAHTWEKWFKDMDPGGELSDRRRIYNMLVGGSAATNPKSQDDVSKSLIPWNQNNTGFLKTVNGQLWCGSLVKIVFTRYMGWTGAEPKYRAVNAKGFDAAAWIIQKLKNKTPVRASLGGHHYVGIVGHRAVSTVGNDFLCLEPWAGGINADTTVKYAGHDTGFLGIVEQRGSAWKYSGEQIIGVEA